MQRALAGYRIRERRREMGLKQIELAERIGVSASYLNLLERNKRRISPSMLAALGRALDLTPEQLDGSLERRLRADLAEMAADPEIADADATPAQAEELLARFPGWARTAARAWRRSREAAAEAEAMSDRLTHDPALGAAVHSMLTEITALRSTSEILAEGGEMSDGQRRRFEQIVFEQSSRLADTGASLAAYFDQSAEARRRRTPASDAEEALEGVADLGGRMAEMEAQAIKGLDERMGGLWAGDPLKAMRMSAPYEPPLPAHASFAETRDAYALVIAGVFFKDAFTALIEDAFAAAPADRAEETERRMREELTRRLADAIILPSDRVVSVGAASGWDMAALTRAADGDAGLAMRRVACLSGAGAPRAAHVTVDAAGRVLSRRGALDLTPRSRLFDCPVWPLHHAPRGAWEAAPVRAADDSRALAVAWAAPDAMRSEMLLIAPEDAGRTVYGAVAAGKPLDVGPDCRICAHRGCDWRREAPVVVS